MDHYVLLHDVRILHEDRVAEALKQARWARAIRAQSAQPKDGWGHGLRRLVPLIPHNAPPAE